MSDAYEVESTSYGMRLTFKGFPQPDDVAQMNNDVERTIKSLPEGFGVMVDMRANRAFSNEAAEMMKGQIDTCRDFGMKRGAVILQSAIMTLQAKRLAVETGINTLMRFIDSSSDPNWEDKAVRWLDQGTEPV